MLAKRIAASTVIAATMIVSGAAAYPADNGSPARPATGSVQDLRSPDARGAAGAAVPATGPVQDLRSPDARDAVGGAILADVRSVESPAAKPTDDVPWLEVAGMGAILALVGSGAAGATLFFRRRRLSPSS
jgi:hypothetical protein